MSCNFQFNDATDDYFRIDVVDKCVIDACYDPLFENIVVINNIKSMHKKSENN